MQADNANFQELLLQFRPKSDNLFEEEIFSYAPCTGSETLQRFETEVLQQLAARLGIQGGVHNIFLYEKVHRNNKDVFVGRSAGIIYEKILSVTSGQATFEHEFPSGDRDLGMVVIYVSLPKFVPSVKHELASGTIAHQQRQPTSLATTVDNTKGFNVKVENAMQRAPPTIKREVRELLNKMCCKYCPQGKTGVFLLGSDRWAMAEELITFIVQDSCVMENVTADTITGLRKHMLKYMSSVNETIRSGKRSGHSMQKRLEEAAAWQRVFGKTYTEGGEIAGLSELRSKFGAGSGTSTLPATLTLPTMNCQHGQKQTVEMDRNGSIDPSVKKHAITDGEKPRKRTVKRKQKGGELE